MLLFILLCLRHKSGMNQTTALFCPMAGLSKTKFVWSFCWVSSKSVCLVWRFWTRCFGLPGVTLSWSPAQHLVGTWDEKCDKISVSLQTVKPSWCLGRPGVLLWSALALCLFALWIFHVLLSSFGNIPALERNRVVSQKWEGSFCASPSDQSRVWGCSGCAVLIQGINLFIEDHKQQSETMGANAFNY